MELKTLTLNWKTYDSFPFSLTEADKQEIAELAADMVDVPDVDLTGYATEEYVKNKIAEAELGGEKVDLSGYAKAEDIPTKVSQLENDKGYLTQHQDISGKLDASALPTAINTALAQAKVSGEFDGKDGADGKDGYTPIKGVDYFDGADGEDGKDGQDGYTPKKGVDYFDGQDGKDGVDGKDGYTPQKGIDYFDGKDGKDGRDGSDGVSATHSWNGTVLTITSASGTSSADLKGAKGDKGDKGDSIKGDKGDTGSTGATGQRGTGLLSVTTAPSSYTTAVGGITPKYRMEISTIKTQAGVTEVLLGDTIRYSYYQYPIEYLDASYAYCTTRVSLRGTTGKTAYQYAQDGGYAGTETEFAEKLANEYTLNPLYGKKVSFLGDSICAGADDDTSYLGGYGKIIADRNNMVYENLAQGGATVTAETYSSSTGTAKGWICRMVDSMSADADYAIIEGGVNDAWQFSDHGTIAIGKISTGFDATLDDTTYYGAFESMLKKLVTKFKGKKIGYIAIPKTMDLYDSSRNAPNFYHIALECCAKWGVSVCDLNTITPPTKFWGTDYTSDGTHPTYEGYLAYYCEPIEAWMRTLTTSGNVSIGTLPTDLDDKYVLKSDISTKKAQITLEDGTTVLIDVVVASAGTTIPKYTNRVPTSIDTDGSVFNGTGYMEDIRLSSSGVTKTQQSVVTTGYIPAKADDVIRIYGCDWASTQTAYNYICAYDSSFTFIGANATSSAEQFSLTTYAKNLVKSYTIDENYNITITLTSLTNIAYIRVCSIGNPEWGLRSFDPEDMIVTVNEEITD